MLRAFTSLLIGAVFGLGLALSEMINPARVIGFLDLTGRWDPTLAFVMAGALMVTLPLFRLVLRRSCPLLDRRFHLPAASAVDRRLVIGAAVFGIGWGLAGFCPGPAIAGLASADPGVFLFVGAMAAGQWLCAKTCRS
jgi:uncharacterized membrane protein YedE/YeeE